jgi:hypothetical protein
MASTFNLSNVSATALANILNSASWFGGATLTIYDGLQPANANTATSGQHVLATFTLPVYTLNTVATGTNVVTITFGSISNVSASYSSTATWFRITNGASTVCDGSVGTVGCDLNINSTSISSGATVSITGFVYSVTE